MIHIYQIVRASDVPRFESEGWEYAGMDPRYAQAFGTVRVRREELPQDQAGVVANPAVAPAVQQGLSCNTLPASAPLPELDDDGFRS